MRGFEIGTKLRSGMMPAAATTMAAAILICMGAFSRAGAQCVDYADYIHWTGGVTTGCRPYAVSVAGTLAYVTDECSGLLVVDISDPDRPWVVGSRSIGGYARGLAMAGTLAYVADGYCLQILDVSNPADPQPIGSAPVPATGYCVAVQAHYAYVGSGYGEYSGTYALRVIDVADPAHPAVVSTLNLSGHSIRSLALYGDYAYLVDETDPSALLLVSITDPAHPVLLNTFTSFGNGLEAIAISGSLAYLEGWELVVLDITDPLNPAVIGRNDGGGLCIALAGNLVFSSAAISDISDPRHPRFVAWYGLPQATFGVAVSGDRCFLTGGDALDVFDFTPLRGDSVRMASITIPNPDIAGGDDFALAGGYAYVSRGSNGIVTVDLGAPLAPAIRDSLGGVTVGPLATNGTLLVGANENYFGPKRFSVFGLVVPSHPMLLGSVPTPGQCWNVAMRGTLGFAAGGSYGLHIMDISRPDAPVMLSTAAVPGSAMAVDFYDHYAIVAELSGSDGGVAVIDIANPAGPRLVGAAGAPGNAYGVTVSGHYAYVAADWAGLHVFDIADPSHPVLVATQDTPLYARHTTIHNGYAYVADRQSGMQVIDVADPTHPRIVGSGITGNLSSLVNRVFITQTGGEYAVVVDNGAGTGVATLGILPVQCSAGTSVAPGNTGHASRLVVAPNPSAGSTLFRLRTETAGRMQAAIFDERGRKVRDLGDRSLEAGEHELAWDGRDAAGHAVAPGVYFIRVTTSGGAHTARVVIAR